MRETNPENIFREHLKNSSPQVRQTFEELSKAIRDLDPQVFSYWTPGRRDLRYSAHDIRMTGSKYHPFIHISPGGKRLIVHLKDVRESGPGIEPRSYNKEVVEKWFRSFPNKISVENPGKVPRITPLIKQCLGIARAKWGTR